MLEQRPRFQRFLGNVAGNWLLDLFRSQNSSLLHQLPPTTDYICRLSAGTSRAQSKYQYATDLWPIKRVNFKNAETVK